MPIRHIAIPRTWCEVKGWVQWEWSFSPVKWKVIMYANITVSLTLVSNKLDGPSPIFSTLAQRNKNWPALKRKFEENVSKLYVNSGNRDSKDSIEQEPISRSSLEFWFYRTTCNQWQWVCLEPVTSCRYHNMVEWRHHFTSEYMQLILGSTSTWHNGFCLYTPIILATVYSGML